MQKINYKWKHNEDVLILNINVKIMGVFIILISRLLVIFIKWWTYKTPLQLCGGHPGHAENLYKPAKSNLHVIVCSTPNNHARIHHMKNFINKNNLNQNSSFSWEHENLFVSKDSEEVIEIINNRENHDFHDYNINLYVAHCLTYIKILQWFVESNIEKLLILEDDIILTNDTINVCEHIDSAPHFDILLLEWCYGQCQNIAYIDSNKKWATNLDAHCTAAVLWTKTAAQKFLLFVENRKRLFNIDELTSQFFATKAALVIYSHPPIIKQDRESFTDGMSNNNGLDLCL